MTLMKKGFTWNIFSNICNQGGFLPWELVLPFLSLSEVETFCLTTWTVSRQIHFPDTPRERRLWVQSWSWRHRSTPRKWLLADFITSGVYPCASPLFRSKSVRGATLCCLRILSLCWGRREGGEEGGQQTQLGKLLSSPKFKSCQGNRQINLEGGNCGSEWSLPISFLDLCLFFLVSVQCGKTR